MAVEEWILASDEEACTENQGKAGITMGRKGHKEDAVGGRLGGWGTLHPVAETKQQARKGQRGQEAIGGLKDMHMVLRGNGGLQEGGSQPVIRESNAMGRDAPLWHQWRRDEAVGSTGTR